MTAPGARKTSSPPGCEGKPKTDRSAVVVGGGIGGLAAARALQQAGWSVEVLEQRQRLEPLGAGISLWPNAVHALAALDVSLPCPPADQPHQAGDVLGESTGVALTGGICTSSGVWLSRTDPTTYPSRYGAPLVAVHRRELQQALLASLFPDTVLTGANVDRVDARPDRVRVQHTHGRTDADLVVLADGMRSAHRHLVTGPAPVPRYAGYTAWRGVTGPPTLLPDTGAATEYWGRGQRFGVVPLTDGSTYWFATANSVEGDRATDGEHREVQRRFAGWQAPIPAVLHASDPKAVLRHDVYDLQPHPASYVNERLLLLGDAAHAMTPDLGQGACQALEDAVTLGDLTSSSADLHSALTAYDRVRRPRARLIAQRSRRIGQLGQWHGHRTTQVRNLIIRSMPPQLTDRALDATLTA